MSHPSPGQPWYQGQPEQNQPQHGGYSGGPAPDAGQSWPGQPGGVTSGGPYAPQQPYSGGPAYPQQQPAQPYSDPGYGQPYSGGPTYPQESYTTEPPYSAQPYDQGYSTPPQQQAYAPAYQQPGYPQQQPVQPMYPQPTPSGGRGGLIALLASLGVLVLLICGIGGVFLVRNSNNDDKNTGGSDPTATATPSGGGTASTKSTNNANAPEYPATIVLPDQVAGLTKLDNPQLQETADSTATQLKTATNADSAVAGFYGPNGDVTRAVGIVGATTRISDPESELDAAFDSYLNVSDIRELEPGPLGGVVKCGNTSSQGVSITVCGWADEGSLALGIFFNRSLTDSGTLFKQIRSEILRRG